MSTCFYMLCVSEASEERDAVTSLKMLFRHQTTLYKYVNDVFQYGGTFLSDYEERIKELKKNSGGEATAPIPPHTHIDLV